VGAELFHADERTNGQTDMTNLIVAFCNFTNAPKQEQRWNDTDRRRPKYWRKPDLLPNRILKLDFHESVHRDRIIKVTNKMQLYRLIYYL